jgi:hypothetical protein
MFYFSSNFCSQHILLWYMFSELHSDFSQKQVQDFKWLFLVSNLNEKWNGVMIFFLVQFFNSKYL